MAKDKAINALVEPRMIHAVNKFVKSDEDLEGQIIGIGNQIKTTRERITIACAAIVIHAALNKTSKFMNALVKVLSDEKQDADARAVIAWAEANGFKRGTDPETKKPRLDTNMDVLAPLKAEYELDSLPVVTRLLSTPYHLSIAKADPYKDYSFLDRIKAEIKKAEKALAEMDRRDEHGVTTNLLGLDDVKTFIGKFGAKPEKQAVAPGANALN